MPDSNLIAKRIKTIREKLGLTQALFAKKLEISTSTVAMYEAGERIPRDEVKARIAKIAGETVDSIFFEDDAHIM